MSLINKKILLGISGGIAAYKCPDLIRQLKKKGAEVRVILTASAGQFVSFLSLQAVSGNPVSQDLFDSDADLSMRHIELAKWADLVIIAPATANIIAKLTQGIADDLLSTLCLATPATIAVLPAMNKEMYFAAITQKNIAKLQARANFLIWGPDAGQQVCGDVGLGRVLEPVAIVELADNFFGNMSLAKNLRFVITAGPTREALDPVRYMSNHSSGQMGFELAKAAAQFGAEVILISGPVSLSTPHHVCRTDVVTAEEMHSVVMSNIDNADIFIACAAVADYRALRIADQKIKKKQDRLEVTLIKNPDILADVAKSKTHRPFVVGFAAETENIEKHALEKLSDKKLDLICANDVSLPNQGFNAPQNAIMLYGKNSQKCFPSMSKAELAGQLIKEIIEHYEKKN